MRWVRLMAACSIVAGCTGSSTPATTPTSVATTSSTTTTAAEVTTTLDRLSEIEAIYQDLEERLLLAVYHGDREAYQELFANEAFMKASMVVFDELTFDVEPQVEVEVLQVVHDGPDCIAFDGVVHRADLGGSSEPGITVLERGGGAWLISYVGTGWICDGPHPFDS
jgi:hypothetical protein